MDIELEKQSIFQGRDEKNIMLNKREQQQKEQRDYLMQQIEEKTRKKELEKQARKQEDARDEMRVRHELGLQDASVTGDFGSAAVSPPMQNQTSYKNNNH